MRTFSAVDAKNNFGELIDSAQREPVRIQKHGRNVAVVMSEAEYEEMKLERIRAQVAVGITQAEKGEFAEDSSLEGLLSELGNERESQAGNENL